MRIVKTKEEKMRIVKISGNENILNGKYVVKENRQINEAYRLTKGEKQDVYNFINGNLGSDTENDIFFRKTGNGVGFYVNAGVSNILVAIRYPDESPEDSEYWSITNIDLNTSFSGQVHQAFYRSFKRQAGKIESLSDHYLYNLSDVKMRD